MQLSENNFDYTEAHFKKICGLVYEHTGITMPETKSQLIYSRISRRIRSLSLNNFDEYCQLISTEKNNSEIKHFINSVTTNLTGFFREEHHFDYLKKTIIPELKLRNQHTRKIRIWSAACSTGKEPYSIAIAIKESIANLSGWDVKILATDIDTDVLQVGKDGIYSEEDTKGLNDSQLKKYFRKGREDHLGDFKASKEIRDLIIFKQLNLMHDWPMKKTFDVVFCRNVIIYFNKETQAFLFNKIAQKMDSGSYMMLGHSESLFNVNDDFKLLGKTIYQRK